MAEELMRRVADTKAGADIVNTAELTGQRVMASGGTKRIGKVRAFVFHPSERRCVGFIVKRPDAALMFRRKDLFVALDGYDMEDGRIVVRDAKDATDSAACKRLGVDYDECVLWVGLPVMPQDQTMLGFVGSVNFDAATGEVESIETDSGATANTLLGRRCIPAHLIKGFKRGMGVALRDQFEEGSEEPLLGAILVDDAAKDCGTVGGVAEKAGEASAIALDKAHQVAGKAGEAVVAGAYATGKQVGKAQGMFSGFKEEYDKARGPKPERRDDDAAADAADETCGEVVEVIEYVEVDEDGNEVVTETKTVVRKKTAQKSTAAATAQNAGKAVGSQLKAAGGMFSAFKDEYKKARHE